MSPLAHALLSFSMGAATASAALLTWLRTRRSGGCRRVAPPHPHWQPGEPQLPPHDADAMIELDPATLDKPSVYAFMISAVVPRPIAFVSTQDAAGVGNLAPYSYFNCMGHNPPLLAFGAARSPSRGGGKKDTLQNIEETGCDGRRRQVLRAGCIIQQLNAAAAHPRHMIGAACMSLPAPTPQRSAWCSHLPCSDVQHTHLHTRAPSNAICSEFVVNIISDWFIEAANHTCGEFARGQDEMKLSGLSPVPSVLVKPPRVREAALQMECKLRHVYEAHDRCVGRRMEAVPACSACASEGGQKGTQGSTHGSQLPRPALCIPPLPSTFLPYRNGTPSSTIVIGEVVMIHVAQAVTGASPSGKVVVDPAKLQPIARLGGVTYGRVTEIFDLPRPQVQQ